MTLKTVTLPKLLIHRYASLGEFISHQEADQQYSDRHLTKSWAGVSSMQEACDVARKGLPAEGVKVLSGAEGLTASAVKQALGDTVRSFNDVSGAYVDMGRFMEGTPECMVENMFELAPVVNPVVSIVSNVTASCAVDADDMRQRGRIVVALIKAVETVGRATELWVDMTAQSRNDRGGHYRISVRVKEASQPLDMGAVMFAFTHPAMMRALCHNAMHSIPTERQREFGVGLGYASLEYKSIGVEESYGPGAVYLPAIHHRDRGAAAAERTVTSVLTDLGIA